MRKYELVVVMRPSLKDADRKKLLDTIKDWMKDIKVSKEEDWGQKPLGYIIKKEVAGHYFMMQLETDAVIPGDLETRIIQHDGVLRHLLLRTK